jgi:hypothetical protein
MWQLTDGRYRVMAGNLEEGINHSSDQSVQTTLNLPVISGQLKPKEIIECWSGVKLVLGNNKLPVYLDRAQTKLFTFK